MRTASITVYSFNELSDKAKDNVRNWHSEFLSEWWGCVDNDFREVLERMGFYGVNPVFALSSRHAEGACFTGHFCHEKPCLEAVKEHSPVDEELARLAGAIDFLPIGFYGKVVRYYGSRECYEYSVRPVDCVVEQGEDEVEATDEQLDAFASIVRDLCRWYSKRLQEALEYETSDEAIMERCELNGYEFTADGRLYTGED